MDARKLKHEAMLMEWREKVMECRSSGKTVIGWCREQGINSKTYYHWEKEVLSMEGQHLAVQESENGPVFVEAALHHSREDITETVLQISARLHTAVGELDVYTGADLGTLQAIIGALKSC